MTEINRFIVNHHLLKDGSNLNELLILEPDTSTITEDILFFHGHQIGVRKGAWETPRYLAPLLSLGYRILVPSILGYGKTTGAADYCGPDTLRRVKSTIKNFVSKPIHIMGASRGGLLAVLFAEHFGEYTRSCTAIAGTYDLESLVKQTSDIKMKQNIMTETYGTAEAFKIRDPKTLWKNLGAPLHIIHGVKDEQIPVKQAEMFAEFLQNNGLNPKLTLLKETGHKLFSEKNFKEIIIPFLKTV